MTPAREILHTEKVITNLLKKYRISDTVASKWDDRDSRAKQLWTMRKPSAPGTVTTYTGTGNIGSLSLS